MLVFEALEASKSHGLTKATQLIHLGSTPHVAASLVSNKPWQRAAGLAKASSKRNSRLLSHIQKPAFSNMPTGYLLSSVRPWARAIIHCSDDLSLLAGVALRSIDGLHQIQGVSWCQEIPSTTYYCSGIFVLFRAVLQQHLMPFSSFDACRSRSRCSSNQALHKTARNPCDSIGTRALVLAGTLIWNLIWQG